MLQLPMTIKDITVNVTINFNNITVEKDKLDSRAIGLEASDVVVDRTNIKSLGNEEYYSKNHQALTNIIRVLKDILNYIKINLDMKGDMYYGKTNSRKR